jgi:hypothetical protein
VPSHRALAILRGRNEDILSIAIEVCVGVAAGADCVGADGVEADPLAGDAPLAALSSHSSARLVAPFPSTLM